MMAKSRPSVTIRWYVISRAIGLTCDKPPEEREAYLRSEPRAADPILSPAVERLSAIPIQFPGSVDLSEFEIYSGPYV